MTYRVEYVARLTSAQADACRVLQTTYGPVNGVAPKRGGRAWLALDDRGGVVGFITATRKGPEAFIENTVVAVEARGNGLQRKLTGAVLSWAVSEHGARRVRTHTSGDNYHSQMNLVDVGFKLSRIVRDSAASGGAWLEWVYG